MTKQELAGIVKWLLVVCLLISSACGICFAQVANIDNIHELVFLNWSEYIDPSLIKEFENKYNAKVREVYYESDELKDQMIMSSEAGQR